MSRTSGSFKMSRTSGSFKVPTCGRITRANPKIVQITTDRVRKWIEDIPTSQNSQEDPFDNNEWNLSGSTSSSFGSQNPKRSRKSKSQKPENVDFVVPHAPPATKHKTFCPIVLHSASYIRTAPAEKTIERARDTFTTLYNNHLDHSFDSSSNKENYNPMRYDLNASFDSHTTVQSNADRVNESFCNIQNYLDQLHTYSESMTNTLCDEDMEVEDIATGGKIISTIAMSQDGDDLFERQTMNFEWPKRTFNENSIEMTLPFTDMKQFCSLVHEENQLFIGESHADDYIDSQLLASQTNLSIRVVSNLKFTIDHDLPSHVKMLQAGLNKIFKDKSYKSTKKYEKVSKEIINDRTQVRIREIFANLYSNNKITIKVRNTDDWKNTKYENGILKTKDKETSKYSQLTSRTGLVLYLLRKIYGLLVQNTQLTKRSIYYQLKSLTLRRSISQDQVSTGINIVSCLLDTPIWHLNVLSTSKGLVYGDLTLTIGNTTINCKAQQNGTTIPMDLNDLQSVESTAYFILIVEKDTVFQKLLVDDLPNKLSRNFILITGKGYADISTRRFIHILWKLLEIPLFIVVDADSYGIEIFLSYKFGCKNTSFLSEDLALPTLKWLGVFPSELMKRSEPIKTMPLSPKDVSRLRTILKRPYFAARQNLEIKNEINVLIKNKQKCEIEGLFQTNQFFANKYLPDKLYQGNFI